MSNDLIMSIQDTINNNKFRHFCYELTTFLKDDPDKKLELTKKLLFYNRSAGSLMKGIDVRWGPNVDDVILVGAYIRNDASEFFDNPHENKLQDKYVSIPFSEVFEDLRLSSGNELKLISMTKEAAIEKYVGCNYDFLIAHNLHYENVVDVGCLYEELKERSLSRPLDAHISEGYVEQIYRRDDGQLAFKMYNSYHGEFEVFAYEKKFKDLLKLQNFLIGVRLDYEKAYSDFDEKIKELQHNNVKSLNNPDKRLIDAALIAMFNEGNSIPFCNAVAKTILNNDFFDTRKRSVKQIINAMERYEKTGSLNFDKPAQITGIRF